MEPGRANTCTEMGRDRTEQDSGGWGGGNSTYTFFHGARRDKSVVL